MLLNSNKAKLGTKAKNFNLLNINNNYHNLESIKGQNGFVIAFICNHCPYVKDIIKRMVNDFNYLKSINVGVVAIMSNDQEAYPDDSFQNMKKFSNENNFTFPYLLDSTQNIAKYYGAVCTPDFFCFNNKDKMFYRGRLDNIKYNSKNKKRIASLVNAVEKMIKFKSIDDNQVSSMGCSIKWKKN